MRGNTLLNFNKSYFCFKKKLNFLFQNIFFKILVYILTEVYILTGVWSVHWIAGSRVSDRLICVFNRFNFNWALALTQPELLSAHDSTRSGFKNTARNIASIQNWI